MEIKATPATFVPAKYILELDAEQMAALYVVTGLMTGGDDSIAHVLADIYYKVDHLLDNKLGHDFSASGVFGSDITAMTETKPDGRKHPEFQRLVEVLAKNTESMD